MVIELEVRIRDAPGTLIELLEPLSANDANIQGIYHMHAEKTSSGQIPVIVTFDLPEENYDSRLAALKEAILAKNIEIVRVQEEEIVTVSFIAIGHVFETGFVDTIKRMSKPGIHVMAIEARFGDFSDPSSVLFTVQLDSQDREEELMQLIDIIGQEKDLTIIKS
jgi:ACT domain-containing protein